MLALLEARLLRDPGIDTDFSGTTLSAVLLRGDQMWAFNVGDSRVTAGVAAEAGAEEGTGESNPSPVPSPARRARLLRRNVGDDDHVRGERRVDDVEEGSVRAVPITVDHKPDLPAEKVRASSLVLLGRWTK